MSEIKFENNNLLTTDIKVELDYKILVAYEATENTIIVLLDPDSNLSKFGQFNNLVALDKEGKEKWTAELPTTTSGDCYMQIVSREPLVVDSFSSYRCQIDLETGKIEQKRFYK